MRTLANSWFVLFCLIWLIIFTGRRLEISFIGFNSYLTDLISVPIIANLGLTFQRVFVTKSNTYRLKAGHVLFIVAYTSLIFEILLPRFSAKYTADMVDILMYVFGGLFFWQFMNRPLIPPVIH
ncbi:MAG: hypothetical protein H7096_03065 [Flavobacterium sp.]|nr:hypothetical protein [Pedobacter sp.]